MPALPLELFHKAIDYLPPLSSKIPSIIFNYKSRDRHTKIWQAIFRDEEWATLVTAKKLKLVLLGTDLQQLFDNFDIQRRTNSYILLSCYSEGNEDPYEDLWKHSSLFRKSLRKHEIFENGVVKLLNSNITLFVVGNILTPILKPWYVSEPKKLFSNEKGVIQSAYLCWDGSCRYKCISLGTSRIGGVCGKSDSLEDFSDICFVKLPKAKLVTILASEGESIEQALPEEERIPLLENRLRLLGASIEAFDKIGWRFES